jgi:hypothetical protein
MVHSRRIIAPFGVSTKLGDLQSAERLAFSCVDPRERSD